MGELDRRMRVPRNVPTSAWLLLTAALLAGVGLIGAGAAGPGSPATRTPPDSSRAAHQIVGPKECSECHERENHVWRNSRHYIGAKFLPRDKNAKQIAKALGIRRIKTDPRCTSCHYTVQHVQDKRPRAVAGVSCESCHGAAGQWLLPHADYGGPDETSVTETPEHREQRLSRCDAQGMIRPDRLYHLAASCYRCHLIADEQVVNVAGHPVDVEFELVAWSQGAMRHNFRRDEKAGNAPCSAEHKRKMYVMGQALRLEYSLRALAGATSPGPYAQAMIAHTGHAVSALQRILAAADIHEVKSMLAVTRAVDLEPGDSDALMRAADQVGAAARQFEASHDGAALEALEALDALVPGPESCKGAASSGGSGTGHSGPLAPTRTNG